MIQGIATEAQAPTLGDLDIARLHEQVLSTYEQLGYPRHVVGSWAISENDVDDLVRLAVEADARKILEVGTFVGVSTLLLALACPSARIVTVDPGFPLEVEMSAARSDIAGVNAGATTTEVAQLAAEKLGVLDRIRFVEGGFAVGETFSSVLEKDGATIAVVGPQICEEEGPFDFAFIDGLHAAKAVEADIALAASAMIAGAPIVLHDCIGFWGANVRSGVFEFLRAHPEYAFTHPRYSLIYKSVGVLRRRDQVGANAARAAFRPEDLSEPLVQALARVTQDLVGRRPVVELSYGASLLAGAYAGTEGYQWAAAEEWAGLLERINAGSAVFSAELADFAPAPLLADVLRASLKLGAPVVMASTPPGEDGVAGPYSRPVAALIDLAEGLGGAVYAHPAMELESERYALLPEPRALGTTSLFATVVVVAAPGGFLDGRGQALVRLAPDPASEREQLELQRTHLVAAYRRYYEDVRALGESNHAAGLRNQELSEEVLGLYRALEGVKTELGVAERRRATVEAEVRAYSERFAGLARSLATFERERDALKGEVSSLTDELAGAAEERTVLAAELDKVHLQHANLVEIAIDMFHALDGVEAEIAEQARLLGDAALDGELAESHGQSNDEAEVMDAAHIAAGLALMRSNAKRVSDMVEQASSALAAAEAERAELAKTLKQIRGSASWRLTAPFRAVGALAARLVKSPFRLARTLRARERGKRLVELQTVLNRELGADGVGAMVFDAEWYALTYKDVPAGQALRHYLTFGEDEGRWPHAKFDPGFYRGLYPDVRGRGTSPLLHFLRFGVREGRSPCEALHPLESRAAAAGLSPLEFYARS